MIFCIIEDHLLVSQFVKRIVQEHYPESTVKTYLNIGDFLTDHFVKESPTLVICDIILKNANGLHTLLANKTKYPDTKFMILSGLADVALVKMALQNGIMGYLTKDSSEQELLEGIRVVLNGGKFLNNSLKNELVQEVFMDEPVDYQLSTREWEVLQQICGGKTPKEIASDMGLSLHTIQQYIRNLMTKFNVKRTTELVLFAIRKKIYNPDTP